MFTLKHRLYSILFWSVISAAFIGPGTLATASSAGVSYKLDLTWALVFATVACIVLQEMAARLAIVSNKSLSLILLEGRLKWPAYFVGLSVVLGCAAYQAGNILGAISGVQVLLPVDTRWLTLGVGCLAGIILWFGKISLVARGLGALVAIMGVLFISVATSVDVSLPVLLQSSVVPTLPAGSEWLVLGLVGTTIVPYNLFLGSGIGQGRALGEMRFGLTVSVILGGLVSIAILISGTQISQVTSFVDLAQLLGDQMGPWAYVMLGLGLFAAGLTSSITSPLAAGVICQGLFAQNNKAGVQRYYRLGWGIVLITGVLFGMLGVKPIPVILAAQALNGLILPIIGVILVVKANNPTLLGDRINSNTLNILGFIVLEALLLIGLNNLWNAVDRLTAIILPVDWVKFLCLQLAAAPFLIYTFRRVVINRGKA